MTDDRESLRTLVSSALDASIDRCARCKVCAEQVDAVMAAVEEEAVSRMAGQFVAESRFRSMQVRDGRIEVEAEPAREIAAMWAGAVRTLLDGAENYAEIEMGFKPAGAVERYAFTLQRVGKLTPHQARQAAEARADASEAKLAAVTVELKAVMAGFFTHYGNSTASSLNLARDLAEGIRQVLDRDKGGTGRSAMPKPSVYELWQEAGGDGPAYDRDRFLELMREHKHLLSPGDDGYEEGPKGLPCEWPDRSDERKEAGT